MLVRRRGRCFWQRIWVATQEFDSCPIAGQEFYVFRGEYNGAFAMAQNNHYKIILHYI